MILRFSAKGVEMETCEFTVQSARIDIVVGEQVKYFARETGQEAWKAIESFPVNGKVCRLQLYLGKVGKYHYCFVINSTLETYFLREEDSSGVEGDKPRKINSAYIEEIRRDSRVVVDKPTHHDGISGIIKNFPWDIRKFKTELHLELENKVRVVLSQIRREGETLCKVSFFDMA